MGQFHKQTKKSSRTDTQPFVAISKFVVANGKSEEVSEAFKNRPHLVDEAPGFIRMDVLRPEGKPEEFWLMTFWTDRKSYETWHRGHTYKHSHKGIPKGLRLDPAGTSLRFFEHISS